MIVSSVFVWLEQIRYKTEVYECNTLEQRKLRRVGQTGETRCNKAGSVGTLPSSDASQSPRSEIAGSKDQPPSADNKCQTPDVSAGCEETIDRRDEENCEVSQRDKNPAVRDKEKQANDARENAAGGCGGKPKKSRKTEARREDVSGKLGQSGGETGSADKVGDSLGGIHENEADSRQARYEETRQIVGKRCKTVAIAPESEVSFANKQANIAEENAETIENGVATGKQVKTGKVRCSVEDVGVKKSEDVHQVRRSTITGDGLKEGTDGYKVVEGKTKQDAQLTAPSKNFTNAETSSTDYRRNDNTKYPGGFKDPKTPTENFANSETTSQWRKTPEAVKSRNPETSSPSVKSPEAIPLSTEVIKSRNPETSSLSVKSPEAIPISLKTPEIIKSKNPETSSLNVKSPEAIPISPEVIKSRNPEPYLPSVKSPEATLISIKTPEVIKSRNPETSSLSVKSLEAIPISLKIPEVITSRNPDTSSLSVKSPEATRISLKTPEVIKSKNPDTSSLSAKSPEAIPINSGKPEIDCLEASSTGCKTSVTNLETSSQTFKTQEAINSRIPKTSSLSVECPKATHYDLEATHSRNPKNPALSVKSPEAVPISLKTPEAIKSRNPETSSLSAKSPEAIPINSGKPEIDCIEASSTGCKAPVTNLETSSQIFRSPETSSRDLTDSTTSSVKSSSPDAFPPGEELRFLEDAPMEPPAPSALRRQVNIDVSKIPAPEDGAAPRRPRAPAPLLKGKSLDSLLDTIGEEEADVVLRPAGAASGAAARRRGFLGGGDGRRRSCALETIAEAGARLEIKHGAILRTSVTFEDTVEDIAEGASAPPVRYFASIPSDLVLWLTDLVHACHAEEDVEMESYAVKDSSHSKDIRFPVDHGNNRKTMAPPTPEVKIPNQSFEKIIKVTVDGKSYKLSKNDVVKLENNKLFIRDEKGVDKTLLPSLQKFERTAKESVYATDRGTVKLYREKEASLVSEKSSFLQKFLRLRTSREDLERKGILRNEPIFGNTLDSLAEKFKQDVPEFVVRVTRLIEEVNIRSPGIYRASGNIATIQKIRLKVDSNKMAVLEEHKEDIDVLAGALKMFFRELKVSLIGRKQYEQFSKILSANSSTEDYAAVGSVIRTLSRPHKETLEHVMRHLLKVIEHEHENQMSVQNMSICWGPSIICFHDSGTTKEELLAACNTKNGIVELLLRTYRASLETSMRPSGSTFSLQSLSSERWSLVRSLHRSQSADDSFASMGSRSSSCTNLSSHRWKFVDELMEMIEADGDVEQAYVHQGQEKAVAKIVAKSRQPRSKTLQGLLKRADVNTLCAVLKECYTEICDPIIDPDVFETLMLARADIKKEQVDVDQEVISRRMRGAIVAQMRTMPLYKYHERLFEHFIRVASRSRDGVSKQNDVIRFWHSAICRHAVSDATVPLVITILDAYDKKRWSTDMEEAAGLAADDGEERLEMRPVSLYDNVEAARKSLGVPLMKISEENLCDRDALGGDLCTEVLNCYFATRPTTSTYTRAQDDDGV